MKAERDASLVEDGISGLIVAAGDAVATAAALVRICSDRGYRAEMAAAARLRAGFYRWEHYGDRLREAVFGAGGQILGV